MNHNSSATFDNSHFFSKMYSRSTLGTYKIFFPSEAVVNYQGIADFRMKKTSEFSKKKGQIFQVVTVLFRIALFYITYL